MFVFHMIDRTVFCGSRSQFFLLVTILLSALGLFLRPEYRYGDELRARLLFILSILLLFLYDQTNQCYQGTDQSALESDERLMRVKTIAK